MRYRLWQLALLLSVAALLGACSDPEGSPGMADEDGIPNLEPDLDDDAPDGDVVPAATSADWLLPGDYGVGAITLELVDASRPTDPNGDFEGAPDRRLVTEVWYPASGGGPDAVVVRRDAELAEGGPWPLVVYSHGFLSSRRENPDLAALLASRGYVVAAIEFPLTSMGAPGGPNLADVVNQPADVSFVIDELTAAADDPADRLAGAVDGLTIVAMGLSLGAMTSLVVGFDAEHGDPRVDVVAVAAAPGCFLPSDFFDARALPVLFVHGDADAIVPWAENGVGAYEAAQAPKMLVTLEDATHTAFAGQAAGLLANLDDPEAIGCAALLGNDSIAASSLADLAVDFGWPDVAGAEDRCPAPCVGETVSRALHAERQIELFTITLVAFVETFAGDAGDHGRLFLDERLAVENAEVETRARWE